MKEISIAVITSHPGKREQAEKLANELQLAFILQENAANYRYNLILTPDFLGLIDNNDKKKQPFYIDFLSSKLKHRSSQAGFRNELIARAIGMKPRENPKIVDATAGLGRDSFILATLGYEVTMLERSPILYLLLKDALERAQNSEIGGTITRMHLVMANAIEWLPKNTADVVYLDPMFPERRKSASVKKEMMILQELLGKDEDVHLLFQAALTCAKKRVVVKRPRLAANFVERAANFNLTGKSSRFDIYLTEGLWNS